MLLFSAINLGCTKNLVDTQYLLGKILSDQEKSHELTYCPDPYDAEVEMVFLNTCGFIKSGRDEMFEVAEALLDAKKKVCIVGCGLQYFESLNFEGVGGDENSRRAQLLKNTNIQVLSRNDFENISVSDLMQGYSSKEFNDFSFPDVPRVYTNLDQGFEYVKIAEGCMNNCSFCIIPQIRGTQKSQSIEHILGEVKDLIGQGAKEIILISQDITRYGVDRYGQATLLELLKEIDQLAGDFVYRLLYLYPDIMTFGWFDELKQLEKFVPYFDLPLQHINSDLLKRMGRFSDVNKIKEFLKYIRESFDESYIRTNFIIGFPGETDAHVEELGEFIQAGWIDNIALFEYHDEPLAASSKLSNKVEESVISERFKKLKSIVDSIQKERFSDVDVGYIMGFEENKVVVRPWIHAPEIDEYVYLSLDQIVQNLTGGEELQIGDIIKYVL